ncbi:MAG TPA: acyl-CoA dehydrogenase family protein [Candidatus Saccharimonadales bacterium]|nr:acyl-CoA dehydrogenase family protein [Candidatus Saccharimonadales bacterium]
MEPFLNEEQLAIRDLARTIAQEKVKPVRARYDEESIFPWDIVEELAKVDLFRVFIPSAYDGLVESGLGVTNMCLATEELSKACAGIALAFAGTALGTFPILLYGTEVQKKKYLPQIASGRRLAAFGLTEPMAGSDASAQRTTARRVGSEYVLNGTKVFITNGGEADIYTTVALTNPEKGARGASCLIIEKGTPGFSFGKKETKMGIHASVTRELIFEDARVPRENLLGREGMGFIVAMKTFDVSRPGVAAQALGIAEGALEEALRYAHQRHQFGQSILNFQGLQWMLADMATQIEAARALIYTLAARVDAGDTKDIGHLSAMAKLYASDVAMKVTTDAVQILGGYGYMTDYPVEKMMRDAKITQIYEGTNQIQRNVIGSWLAKEGARLAR